MVHVTTKGQNMENVRTIHHIKALAIAHHVVQKARKSESREISFAELVEIEVAIKMAVDHLTALAAKN